jgi:pSer/pThr/pTyr-binding forkhead associated (FHA) protein
MPYLKRLDQAGKDVRSYILQTDSFTVGRGEDADAQIDDPGMSRVHFALQYENGEYVLVDRESTNGTFVNEGRVKRRQLNDGDVISAGGTRFLYEYGASTMIGAASKKVGKSVKSELADLYKQLEQEEFE